MRHTIFLLFCLLLLVPATAWSEPVRLSGTGAAISAMRQVTDLYRQKHPETRFEFVVPPMGSSGAIKAVTSGKLEIALSGRPLQPEETSAGLQQIWLGRSPFLFVVHRDAPVTGLSMAQVAEMYAGRQKLWPDGSRVRVVLRPMADADTALLRSLSPDMDAAVSAAYANRQPGAALAETDVDLADMVEKVPGGLGSVALTLILAERRPLKGVSLDGVEPTVAAMEAGRYPGSKPLYLVMRSDAPPPVQAVAEFIRSAEGQAVLQPLGLSATYPP